MSIVKFFFNFFIVSFKELLLLCFFIVVFFFFFVLYLECLVFCDWGYGSVVFFCFVGEFW